MVLSRLLGRGAKDRKDQNFAAKPLLPLVVRRSVFEDADDWKIVSAVINEYVNPLMHRGYYLRSELPPNVMRSYHTDYYMAQVANGGHGQFMHNSRMEPLILRDIREGLAAIGIEHHVGLFRDFEAFVASDLARAAAVAGNCGFGEQDPIEAALDKRFFAVDCYKTLMPANGRWLKGLPELKVVPDADFAANIEALIVANPQASPRKFVRKREQLAALLQDILHVAARLLAHEASILPVQIGGGDPAAKTPDGRSAVGWAINAHQGQFTMFVLDDAVLLCEQYLADGRKVTRELMNETRSALLSGKSNLEAIKGFEQKVWKEIARLPTTLVEEAKAVAKDGNILAAAEIACAKLQDELLDLYALTKNSDGIWCFVISAKGGHYFMVVHKQGMVVKRTTAGAPGVVKTEPLVVRLEEVRRYKAANDGGHA